LLRYILPETFPAARKLGQLNATWRMFMYVLFDTHSKNCICWIDNDVCYVRFVMLRISVLFHHLLL